MRLILTVTISALMLSPTLADTAETYALTPTGDGDPNAITCRVPQALPGLHRAGPEACNTNAEWARYRADRLDVTPDGHIVAARGLGAGDHMGLNPGGTPQLATH